MIDAYGEDHVVDPSDVERWVDHLRDCVDDGGLRFADLVDAHGGVVADGAMERVIDALGELLELDPDRAAAVLLQLGAIEAYEADCGGWVDEYYRGRDEDAVIAAAEARYDERE